MDNKMLCLILLISLMTSSFAMEFNFIPFTMNTMDDMRVSPKFERLQKIEVAPINSNVKPNFNLLEFILLDMDFDYMKSVPSYKRLTYTMPDM